MRIRLTSDIDESRSPEEIEQKQSRDHARDEWPEYGQERGQQKSPTQPKQVEPDEPER